MTRRFTPDHAQTVPDAPWPGTEDRFKPMDGVATITVWRNPLRPSDRITKAEEPGRRLIDWLTDYYPHGFGRPIQIVWNGDPWDVMDSDRIMEAGDVIGIYVTPGAAAIPLIIQAVITAVVTLAATLIVNLIFGKPKGPKGLPKPDPVYSLSGASNSPRLNEPIPTIYGRVITVPDWAMQPYTFYENNNMFLDEILVIGWGEYQIDDVIVGDTPVNALTAGTVTYTVFPPSAHASTMGNIYAATGIMENVITSAEVADQELSGDASGGSGVVWIFHNLSATAPSTFTFTGAQPAALPGGTTFQLFQNAPAGPNSGKTFTVSSYNPSTGVLIVTEATVTTDSSRPTALGFATPTTASIAGPFVVGKPGVRGNRILCDFVFPNGLYTLSDKGKINPGQVDLIITAQPINDAGANAGAAIVTNVTVNRATNTPVRITQAIDVPVGRYTVKVQRTTPPPPDTQTVNNMVWTSLKFRLIDTVTPVYGAVTLLAIRIKATNGIASDAAARVRVKCTRKLPLLGSGPLVATRNPADAFVDIYCNQTYGARRPLSEVDLATLTQLKAHWANRAAFDAVFVQRGTVWDALGYAMQPAGAAPLPDGQLMSVMQDGLKALRTQMFSDANMAAQTLEIGYSFDRPGAYDGMSVEYRNPDTFAAEYAVYPAGAVDVEQTTLFGCTDKTTAERYARLLWQRKLYQRKSAQFETELEGMLPRFGDRVAIASQLPRWGRSGVIVAVSGLLVLTDEPQDWTGGPFVMVLRDEDGRPSALIPATRGNDDDEVMLGADPGFPISAGIGMEPTHYSFGTATQVVRDFLIADLEHLGGQRFRVGGLIYDPRIYANTLPWMGVPI